MTPNNHNPQNRFMRLGILLLLIFSSLFHLNSFHSYHNWGPDFAKYIGQAMGIVDGFKYLEIFKVGEELPIYPWGFPVLLAPIYAIFGFNLHYMKVYVTVFLLLSLPLLNILVKDRLTFISRLGLLVFIIVNPWTFYFKNNILSDFPYLFFSILSIFLIQYLFVDKRTIINTYFDYCLIGVVIAFTGQIRTQGFVLLPVLLIAQYLNIRKWDIDNSQKRIKNQFIELIPLGIIILSVSLFSIVFPEGNDLYFGQLKQYFNISWIVKNIKYYLVLPIDFFGKDTYSAILYGLSLPFFMRGLINRYKTDFTYILFSILTLGLLIIWPYQQGPRFILSIIPYFMYFVFKGLEISSFELNIFQKLNFKKKILPIFACILIIFLFSFKLGNSFLNLEKIHVDGPFTIKAQEMFEFLNNETDNDALVMFKKPPTISLFANRKSINELADYQDVIHSPADYYVYHPSLSNPEFKDDLFRNLEQFNLVFDNGEYQVFKLSDLSK